MRVASAQPTRHHRRGRWLVPLVLAVPFLVAALALRGLTVALPVFHGSDELVYQFPTILQFSRQLPFPDLHHYASAQTPLFHLVMAYAGKLVGFRLWRLRLLEVVISYGLALAVFGLLNRRLRMERLQALALTLLFVLSPYVFGQSFRLVTDNLAMLLSVVALERFERFREAERLGPFLAGCAAVGAAISTRQSTAFLLGVGAFYALRPGAARLRVGERVIALLAVLLSALPAGLLFLNWHGLVPVGSDPSSCGLCASGRAQIAGGLEVQSAELALATIGLYGAVLFAPLLIAAARSRPSRSGGRDQSSRAARGPLAAAGAGGLLLLAFPASPGAHAAGDIWRAAGHLPRLDGSSLLFWLLVPLSGAVLWIRVRAAPTPWLVGAFAACFLISAVVIRYPWQKYVDPFALLVLLLSSRPAELASAGKLAGAAVLAVAFLAYALDFSSHRSVPRPQALVRSCLVTAGWVASPHGRFGTERDICGRERTPPGVQLAARRWPAARN
ncbi:MAG: glycosyltransferase family 39 protein [Actinomycetota bacterium]|nr:glycosyltransferase family 39 protein [Actinomycetota bacterium]